MFSLSITHPDYFQHPLTIAVFVIIIIGMLVLDLGVFNKDSHEISNKEAIVWSLTWIGLAMLFSGGIWYFYGFNEFADFQSAYWIEKALSVDNLFVFILVFQIFKVPKIHQHKVLFWGIIGAIIMRAIFIFAGVKLIKLTYLPPTTFNGLLSEPIEINAVMTVFGLGLLVAAWKSAFASDVSDEKREESVSTGIGAKIMNKLFRIYPEYDEGKFFTVKNGVRYGTQLLLVVGIIEFTDLLFAIDSIPAIFAITDAPFILYSSNIFAILGLRSLYFVLANFMHLFHFLNYGLALVLGFIGVKMIFSPIIEIESGFSLIVIGSLLGLSVIASLLFKQKENSEKTS
ncbi:MAG TPA: TerC/Alx family metal homeostasis membrane protein [Flavobacteriaceae bacterium]|nr:TerC/Alx family metal homeostasis membrane protein [Flavobacteriaceae bacterium]